MTGRALTMSVCKLFLLGLLAVCSASALSKDLVTDVDTHRTKVRPHRWVCCGCITAVQQQPCCCGLQISYCTYHRLHQNNSIPASQSYYTPTSTFLCIPPQRQALTPPIDKCSDGDVQVVTDPQDIIWKCSTGGKWLPYR